MSAPLIAAGYAVATVLAAAVCWRSLRSRPRPGAAWLAVVMAGVVWWSALSVGVALVTDPQGQVGTLLGRLEWFGIAVIAVGMVRFGFAMSGRDSLLSRRGVAALLAVPFAWATVSLAHADVIGLFEDVAPPVAVGLSAMEPLVPLYVWLNPVVLGGIYLALAIGTLLLLETAFERPAGHVRQLLVLLMVLPPWTLNVLYLTGITPNAGYDPTVLGFVVTGVAGLAAVDRFRLLEAPFARSEVVEELDTPILAFGADGRLYDYNDRAATALDVDRSHLDEPVERVLDRTPLSIDAPVTSDGGDTATPAAPGGADAATPAKYGDADAGTPVATPEDTDAGDPTAWLDGATATVPADRTGVDGDRADDGPRHYLVTTTELDRRGGRSLGSAVQLSDVTRQRRQAERIHEKSARLERKNEQLERLAGIVAHDMQTPVATGKQLLDLLRADVDATDEAVGQSLDDLERVLDRLDEFAEHVPQLARESVDVDTPVECDLDAVVRRAWSVVETGDLELSVAGSTPLEGDPRRLQQAFENLFRNAVEHGVRGAGAGDEARTVEVGTIPAEHSDPPATITDRTATSAGGAAGEVAGLYLQDDGPGIPADRRNDVFGFGEGDGTGYGLAIVRTIVEAHGWSIEASEGDDGGARFEITFEEG